MKQREKRIAVVLALAFAAVAAAGYGTARSLADGKTQVTITNVSVADKTYDGSPAVVDGVLSITDPEEQAVSLTESDLVYRYVSTDGGGYDATVSPSDVGAYTLTVSVADTNTQYEGASDPFAFTIAEAVLTITPSGGECRYVGMANPTFSYTYAGALPGQTPAFTGALTGAGSETSPEGVYAISLTGLALADNDTFLAKNYTLALSPNSLYRVEAYPAAVAATVSGTAVNGIYTGSVTLSAPDGYRIAFSLDAASWAGSAVKSDCTDGDNDISYYLRVSGGENDGAITEQKLLTISCDKTAPAVSLHSPAADSTDAAAAVNQKIIFLSGEPVTAVSGGIVTVSDGTTDYTAAASDAVLIGSADGPWYLSFDPASFKNGETGLSLAAGTTYTVSETGAFADAAGHPDGALSASFTTAASSQVADPVAVVYTPAGAAPTVRTSANLSVASGQAVARGTQLSFTVPTESGYTVSRSVTLGGAAADETDLSDVTLTGDLEVYITREPAALSGQASVSGTAAYGEPLSGSVTGANQPDEANWTFTWVRRDTTNGDTLVARGGSETGYTPSVLDIGETIRLEVTDSVCSGTLYAETAVIAKAAYAGPAVLAPTTQTLTETSVTLVSTDGYEYSLGGSVWQSESAFTGLTSGETYEFYQRVAATDTTLASAAGLKTAVTTVSPLTGDVSITGTAQSGKTLTASLTGSNNTGELTYTWKRGTSTVGIGAQYTAEAADIGQTLTVEVTSSIQTGTLTASTAAVTKAVCSQSTPAAPTLASATATSITLTATNGYQYSLGGVSWQDTTTFHNLTTGTSYTFYQRVAETDTEFCSAAGPAATLSTLPGLTGTIMSSGEARYGMTIVASLSDSNNTGTLTYTWKRGTVTVGTGTTYTVSAIDIGNQLSLEVTSSMQGGSVTRSYGTVAKAYYFGDTPDAPTRYSRSSTKVILNSVDGCEYSKNGTTWQDSTTFSGLTAGTTYSFYQRYEATATMEASPASEALSVTTSSSSSTSSDSSDDSDDSDATPTPDSSTSLYSYTLTSDNTRILYSTMKSLAAGNETSDVTIKQSGVEITFLKGTMTDSYSQLWYDFGVTVNDSIREQTAKSLGGDAYVATVHFNYEGTLPGQASIRISLGAANAGKTLSYYRLEEDDTLTFLQTAVADSAGWATVTQESCSDYVFLDSEKAAAAGAATATPADTPSVSPTPAGDSADADGWNLTSDVWFIAAIILLAVALIIGGIWLYTKNRDSY